MVELQHAPGDRSIFGGVGKIAAVSQRAVVLKADIMIVINKKNPMRPLPCGGDLLAITFFVRGGFLVRFIRHSCNNISREAVC